MDEHDGVTGKNAAGWRSLESVAGWDKFTLYVKDDCVPPKYKVRWTDDAGKQRPRTLKARDLVSAREEALGVIAEVISPVAYIHDRKDPTFGEIWPSWEAFRAEETTIERQILLRSRWANYYRDRLGPHRCSNMESELKKFRDELIKHGKPWKEGIKTSKGRLHPNTIDRIFMQAGIFDLLQPGATQTAKGRPLAPISGPLWWVFRERIARIVADRHVLLYRSEGITKKTRSQTMRRIRRKAGLDDAHLVTWYSIRHTLGDFLFERVSGLARSMLLGHADLFDESEKRKLLDPRSPTSEIYRREKLKPLYEIADVLNREWWPEIQKHCKTDLRLGEADSQQIRLVYVSELKQGDSSS